MRVRPSSAVIGVAAVIAAALLVAPGAGARAVIDETDLQVTQTASPEIQQVSALPYGNITWTIVVTNAGPSDDTNVALDDPIPLNDTYVDATTTAGTCTGGATLQCSLGTLKAGDVVTVTLVTNPTKTGEHVNTATVTGDLPDTDGTNNAASATAKVVGCVGCHLPSFCTAVVVSPHQLYVGRPTTMQFRLERRAKHFKTKPLAGVRVHIHGAGINLTTARSDRHGRITQVVQPRRKGVVFFKPVGQARRCKVTRVGVTGTHPPPVTG